MLRWETIRHYPPRILPTEPDPGVAAHQLARQLAGRGPRTTAPGLGKLIVCGPGALYRVLADGTRAEVQRLLPSRCGPGKSRRFSPTDPMVEQIAAARGTTPERVAERLSPLTGASAPADVTTEADRLARLLEAGLRRRFLRPTVRT